MKIKQLLIFLVFLCSCTESKKILPNSTGSNSEIIFVVDDNIWEQQLKKHAQKVFMVSNSVINSRNFNLPYERSVVWTVNDENEFQRLMELSLYGIITDIPDTMQLYKK